MEQEKENRKQKIQQNSLESDFMEQMLLQAYAIEKVPDEVNIRLKNQLACQQVIDRKGLSFWWLPATISTIVSMVIAIILCLLYVIINIESLGFWMPNLLQRLSEAWLKFHLIALVFEITASWIVTFFGVWKGNLVRNARLF